MEFLRLIFARLRAWWASQIMDEPEDDPTYHTLPYPEKNQSLPHNEEYHIWQQPDAGQSEEKWHKNS